MRKNPWVFGMIFMIIVVIIIFNNFEFPKILFFNKTNSTDAVIIQTKEVVGRIPLTTDFINTYIFEANDAIYISSFRKPSYQNENYVGDSLKIKYNIKNPNDNKVIGYYRNIRNKPFAFWEQEKYTGINGNKNIDLILNNLVFMYIEYEEYGNVLSKTGGLYEKNKDTIRLRPLVKYFSEINYEFETILPLKKDFKNCCFIILYKNKIQEIDCL